MATSRAGARRAAAGRAAARLPRPDRATILVIQTVILCSVRRFLSLET